LSWDADTAQPIPVETHKMKSANSVARNPIALTGNLGDEVDNLRCTPRPRTSTPREPQRDPISGKGNFGKSEWDPIYKHSGKARRARSSTGDLCNPLTGENAKTFNISMEEKNRGCFTPKAPRANRNVLTGENCSHFEVSADFKRAISRRKEVSGKNALTGENCETYDVNIENARTGRAKIRPASKSISNPVSGENVSTFTISKEERPREAKAYVYTNALTGENCPSFKINAIERNVTSRPNTAPSNPLLGENTTHYKYRVGEKEKSAKKRDISSPLTGPGSRGTTYSVFVEERRKSLNGVNGTVSRSQSSRNILTGENCSVYQVCQEMRSERKSSVPTLAIGRPGGSSYNILTGAEC